MSWFGFGPSAKSEPVENINKAHKDLTDKIRARGGFVDLSGLKPGDSIDQGSFLFHKPTLQEREIMIDALNVRAKDLPEAPEKIVDLIYIVDSDMKYVVGFYHSRYDRIFIRKDLISSPSILAHVIPHEYTHYQYMLGHEYSRGYSSFNEEKRAETHAVKGADCIGCGGEYAKLHFDKLFSDFPYLRWLLGDKIFNLIMVEDFAYQGYIATKHYLNPDVISHMSKGYCPNCLESVKNRLVKTPDGIEALEEKREAANKKLLSTAIFERNAVEKMRVKKAEIKSALASASEEDRLVGDEMLDYPLSSYEKYQREKRAKEYERKRAADAARMAEVD